MIAAHMTSLINYGLPALGIGVGMTVLAQLGLRCKSAARQDRRPILAMAVFVTVVMIDLYLGTADINAPSAEVAWRLSLGLALMPALPLSLWVYVRSLTEMTLAQDGPDSDPGPDPRPDLRRHLVAPLIAAISVLPLFALSAHAKAALVAGVFVREELVLEIIALVGTLVSWGIWIVMLVVYGIAIVRRLVSHRRRIRDLYSNLAPVDLRWVHVLIACISIAIVLTLADQVSSFVLQRSLATPATGVLFGIAILFVFGIFGLHQDASMPHWRGRDGDGSDRDAPERDGQAPDEPAPDRLIPGGPGACAAGPSYARSGLDEDDCRRVVGRLDARMQQDRLWRDPFLNLSGLAHKAGVKPNAISQALNTHLSRNFFDYVNGWRINEACERLRDSDDSVIGVSETVGFNSKSTFNAAFKKATGQTPTQYRAGSAARRPDKP